MKKIRLVLVLTSFLVAMSGWASAGSALDVSAFQTIGQGSAVPCFEGSPAGALCFSGEGMMTKVGPATWDAFLVIGDLVGEDGTGGACFLASGESTHYMANGSVMSFGMEGLFCGNDFMMTDPPIYPPYPYTATYRITGGTGRFEGVAGSGNLCGNIDENYNVLVNVNGVMTKP